MNGVSTFKRIEAYILDVLLVYLFISLVISIRVINPYYDKYSETYEKYHEVVEKYQNKEINDQELVELNKENAYYLTRYSISTSIVTVLVLIGYFVVFQKFNHGQTLGKKIMKIKVVNKDNKEVSFWQYLVRNIFSYYVIIRNIIATITGVILVFVLDSNSFLYVNTYLTYAFIGLGIISVVMIIISKEKRGLHDIVAKTKVISE